MNCATISHRTKYFELACFTLIDYTKPHRYPNREPAEVNELSWFRFLVHAFTFPIIPVQSESRYYARWKKSLPKREHMGNIKRKHFNFMLNKFTLVLAA